MRKNFVPSDCIHYEEPGQIERLTYREIDNRRLYLEHPARMTRADMLAGKAADWTDERVDAYAAQFTLPAPFRMHCTVQGPASAAPNAPMIVICDIRRN